MNKPTRREFLRKSVLGAVGTGAALTAFRTEELLADSQITRDARSWYSEKGELTMKTPSTNIEPFKINISDEVLNDLTARLKATRFAPDLNNDDMFYGLSTKYMKDLVDHWLNKFNWKKSEKEINSFNQHRIEIEGTPVHFIYERGKGPNPTPIILSHGWPWTLDVEQGYSPTD